MQVKGSELKFYWLRGNLASVPSQRFFLHLLAFTDEKHAHDLFAKEPLFYERIIMNLSKPISVNQEDNLHIIQSSIMAFYYQ